jgi:DNA-binding NarL/FixJ family response regulator
MRIILADPHEQARRALKTRLAEAQHGFEVIGEATNAQELLRQAGEQAPDLVLVDYDLPGSPIEQVIAGLHALNPVPFVLVMSRAIDCGRKALNGGADAFVSKGDQPDWLLDKLHKYAKQIDMKEVANREKNS